jgi:hypothetical protein
MRYALLIMILIPSLAFAGGYTSGEHEVDGTIYVDGTLYNATITIGSKGNPMKLAGVAMLDPCPTLGKGSIFINGITGAPCFCNSLGVDLSLYNGTSSCF